MFSRGYRPTNIPKAWIHGARLRDRLRAKLMARPTSVKEVVSEPEVVMPKTRVEMMIGAFEAAPPEFRCRCGHKLRDHGSHRRGIVCFHIGCECSVSDVAIEAARYPMDPFRPEECTEQVGYVLGKPWPI